MTKSEFIDKVVFGYIRKDLEAIKRDVPKKPGEEGNINFPIALCVLAYVEYLGEFLTGLDRNFLHNVETYIKDCFDTPDGYNALLLKDIFRNGLAHEYFARGGVARDGIRPALYKDHEGEVVLDADTLLDDFLKSLEVFAQNLTDKQYKKRSEHAKESIKGWRDKHKAEINKLPSIADIPHARTSGASTYPENITRAYDQNE